MRVHTITIKLSASASASASATRVKERKRATWLLVGTKSVFVLWYSRYLSAVGCSQVELSYE